MKLFCSPQNNILEGRYSVDISLTDIFTRLMWLTLLRPVQSHIHVTGFPYEIVINLTTVEADTELILYNRSMLQDSRVYRDSRVYSCP